MPLYDFEQQYGDELPQYRRVQESLYNAIAHHYKKYLPCVSGSPAEGVHAFVYGARGEDGMNVQWVVRTDIAPPFSQSTPYGLFITPACIHDFSQTFIRKIFLQLNDTDRRILRDVVLRRNVHTLFNSVGDIIPHDLMQDIMDQVHFLAMSLVQGGLNQSVEDWLDGK